MTRYGYRAVVRLAIFASCFALLASWAFAQDFSNNPANPYDASLSRASTNIWMIQAPFMSAFPPVPPSMPVSPVSVDILRYPLSGKAHAMLRKATDMAMAGQHSKAIEQLRQTLLKYPAAAPYVHSGLGLEYALLGQFAAAVGEMEQATQQMPHMAETHSLFARVLLRAGDYGRAEREARQALALDPHLPDTEEVLLSLRRRKEAAQAASLASPASTPVR